LHHQSGICLENEQKHNKPQAGLPVPWLKLMMYSLRTNTEQCFPTAGCDFMYASQKTLFRIIQDLEKNATDLNAHIY